jgi:hypothetical protein
MKMFYWIEFTTVEQSTLPLRLIDDGRQHDFIISKDRYETQPIIIIIIKNMILTFSNSMAMNRSSYFLLYGENYKRKIPHAPKTYRAIYSSYLMY